MAAAARRKLELCRAQPHADAVSHLATPTRPHSYGDVKSAEPSTFLGVYQLYFFFPFLVIARLALDRPFTRALPSGRATLLWFYGSATFAVFFSYVAKWLVTHMPGDLPDAFVSAMQAAKQLP